MGKYKAFALVILAGAFGLATRGTAVELAPGETRVIGSESVHCAEASKFAKAYYSCDQNGMFPKLQISVLSDTNQGGDQSLYSNTLEACQWMQNLLTERRSNITQFTETFVCGIRYGTLQGTYTSYLVTFVTTPNGQIQTAKSEQVASFDDCLKTMAQKNTVALRK